MLVRNLLLRFPDFSKFYAISGNAEILARSANNSRPSLPVVNQNFATTSPPGNQNLRPPRKISTMHGMREFFMHPLTWDRNNGFFNILLGLAIFGYCFCTSCQPNKPVKMSHEADKTPK